MVKIGAIKKLFKGWRILICAYVSDNSPLKSQYFTLCNSITTGKKYIKMGKGYDPKTDTYPRLVVFKWSLISYIGKSYYRKSFVWFGIGRFMNVNW